MYFMVQGEINRVRLTRINKLPISRGRREGGSVSTEGPGALGTPADVPALEYSALASEILNIHSQGKY